MTRPSGIGRLSAKECEESYRRHNNPNIRRMTDEEYDLLQKNNKVVQRYFEKQKMRAERIRHERN